MNDLARAVEKGKALRAQGPAPSRPPQPGPARRRDHRAFFEESAPAPEETWEAEIVRRAQAQLADWIDTGVDYAAERTRLIRAFAETCRTNPDYAAQNLPVTLQGAPYTGLGRKGRIAETLARWVWLEKRLQPREGGYGGRYVQLTPGQAAALARLALDQEIARRS